ncbi:SUF system Fe-S cluster assembly protein [Rhodovibrionaceae bacterium A322]
MSDSQDHPAPHYNPYLYPGAMAPAVEEGFSARAGEPKDETIPTADEASVVAALQEVYDPEIPVNIYDLGLIYQIKIHDNGNVDITMTLTAPACPVAGEMPGDVSRKVAGVFGVGEVETTLTWEPPWTKEMMSEDAQLALGIF